MNTTQIKCFISLAKTNNFTRTAQEMFMSESSISKNIKNLEDELGFKLITRQDGVGLTPQGKFMLDKFKLVDQMIDNAVNQAKDIGNHPQITLGITAIPFEYNFIPKLVKACKNKNFSLKIKTLDPAEVDFNNELLNNQVDIALFQKDMFDRNPNVASDTLVTGDFLLLVSPQNYLSSKKQIMLDDLKGRKVYLWEGYKNIPQINKLKNLLKDDYPQIEIIPGSRLQTIGLYVKAEDACAIVPSFVMNSNDDFRYIHIQQTLKMVYAAGYLKGNSNQKPEIFTVIDMIKHLIDQED